MYILYFGIKNTEVLLCMYEAVYIIDTNISLIMFLPWPQLTNEERRRETLNHKNQK